MREKVIPYGKQFITEEDIDAVVEVLKSDYLTQGPTIELFEKSFAEYVGCKYAVAVANGTAALHLSVIALGLEKGKKVITSPITFAASANCVLYAGGQVDFCDINPDTYLIDIKKIEEKLNNAEPGTYVGIIPVDLAGYPVNTEELNIIAKKNNLWILEDACHAPGGGFTDSKGSFQLCGNGVYINAAVFSFHPVKHIATGEGGMITTNRKDIYEKLILLRTHGITKEKKLLNDYHGDWYYEMQMLGFNYRLTDIQAALGISQLKKANWSLKQRQKIAKIYREELKSIGDIRLPFVENNVLHAYHLFIILTSKRKELYNYLRQNGIFAQVHYIPIHYFPYYREKGWKKGDFPIAEAYYNECLSLPMYPSLSDDDLNYVIDKIKSFYR
jgi:UDP-4-amino-4,6-dideoxy-N-acetyl-beta-L-altrosamine transaminase